MARLTFDQQGNLLDVLTGEKITTTPEEKVRQEFILTLIDDYCYPKARIRREVPIWSGSKELLDKNGDIIRADIVVYNSDKAAKTRDQGNILFVVECKKPTVKEGYNQLVSYIFNTSATGGIWTNGDGVAAYGRKVDNSGLDELTSIPRYGETWNDFSDMVPDKIDLPHPKNIRFLLSSCHNKLYGRGMENQDYDLVMDMVRILLAKIQDESCPGAKPRFWLTKAQFKTMEGRSEAVEEVQKLFREYADHYPDVFEPHERIQVGIDCVAEAIGLLQGWRLSSLDKDADDWDLMGETYEQFTHVDLKRQKGQYFTNRLVVEMMVSILDPQVDENALDPAGGSGGFATAIYRHLRQKVLRTTAENDPARDRRLSMIKNNVFLVEVAPRLVKIAKCAMLLTGDGQSGMTHGNSLSEMADMDNWIQARCCMGKSNAPRIIATNPPFAGQKAESQITDKLVLARFDFGHSFDRKTGTFVRSERNRLERQAPELLFLERCVNWVHKDSGRIGIIMPKGFLDGVSYEAYRQWLMDRCFVRGVVTLHKDTFQPDTGVRTCVLFLEKKTAQSSNAPYPIFMAMSQRVGQDSKGNKIFKIDCNGNPTEELDQDLGDIAKAYESFKAGTLRPSDCIFSISSANLKDHVNLNPQHYSPKLNKALSAVLDFDDKPGWSVTTIGALEQGIEIYLGPRWNSANLKSENPNKDGMKPYLTAQAVFEITRNSMKWMDITKANARQKADIASLKVNEGDILITRSGSIGRVTYATRDLSENYIISDDLVRIRIKDPDLRAYLLVYLRSETAKSLMMRDEYGSVQQHLQPRHIQEMVIPVPDNFSDVKTLIDAGNNLINAMEAMNASDSALRVFGFDSLL